MPSPAAAPVEEVPTVEPDVDTFVSNAGSEIEQAFASLEALDTETPKAEEPPKEEETPKAEETPKEEEETPKAEETPKEEDHDPTAELEIPDEDLKDWTPKAADAFKRYKGENKQLRGTVESLEVKVAQYEQKIKEVAGSSDDEAFTKLQERLEGYERTMAATNLEQTAIYKEAVTDPLNALFQAGTEIGKAHGLTDQQVLEVFQMSPEAQETTVRELMPESTERERARMFRLFDEVGPILERKAELKENAQVAVKEAKVLEEQRAAEAAAEAAEQRKVNAKTIVDRMSQRIPFLAELEGFDSDKVIETTAEKDPATVHPVDFAYYTASAQVMPALIKAFRQQQLELESVTDQLADLKGAEPGLSGGTPGSVKESPKGGSEDVGFDDKVSAEIERLGLSR